MSVQFGKWDVSGEPPTPSFLKKIEAILAPCGPDGISLYSSGGTSILYAAFQVTPESRSEIQPLVAKSGAVVTWDGRLDNRAELLDLIGHELPDSSPDVVLVAAAYESCGMACLRRVLGDWALSIWNPADCSLLLAKDPIGTRPLYYSFDARQVAWSTLLDPLVLFTDKTLEIDYEYIAGCLSFFPAVHLTPFSGILSVPPSSLVRIRNGRTTIEKYWDFDPAKNIRYAHDGEYEEHFRELFAESVRRRLRSGAPVLAELSGGMDSSSIVCAADALLARGLADAPRLDTVSYYDDSEPNWNERPYFRKIEEQRGRTGLHINVETENSLGTIFKNGPLRISPASDGAVSESRKKLHSFVAANGHRVLLSGFGGDEVLGGVPVPTSELADLLSRIEVRSLTRQLKIWSLDKRTPWFHLLWATIRRFLPATLSAAPGQLRPASWLIPRFVAQHRSALTGYENRLRMFGPLPTFQENVATIAALRRQLGLDTGSLEGIYEKRYPYLDRDLLEFLFAVPREQLLRPGQRRSLLRRALAGIVPDEVLNRKRKAFVVRRPLVGISEHFDELLEDFEPMLAASMGIVDSGAFCKELHKARAGRDTFSLPLLRTIGVEAWLQNLAVSGLLKNPEWSSRRTANKESSAPRQHHDLSAESQSQTERR
jgi:asparagine synthase (glutamine-hydrolysing)